MKIDLKDRKILYELDLNCRQGFNQIARKVRLSKDSVIYRINKLKEAGLIQGFQTVINVGKLNYKCFRLYLNFIDTTPQIEKEIIHFFQKKKEVVWLASIEDEYDLGMWIFVKSIIEMDAIWHEFHEKYINYFEDDDLSILTKIRTFSKAYLTGLGHNKHTLVSITAPSPVPVTNIGWDILKLMSVNARISLLDLSRKLNVSTKTISTHIKKLEKDKIIVGYRAILDLNKLDYKHFKMSITMHNITKTKIQEFRYYVEQHPNIVYDNEVLGGQDLEIEIQVQNLNELRKLISDIKHRFSKIIRDYNIMEFYEQYKFSLEVEK